MANISYGVKRHISYEQSLIYVLGDYGLFTTKEAEEVYLDMKPERREDSHRHRVNARNYLAGAITAGVLRRVRKGFYEVV